MKRCFRCKVEKPLSEFGRHTRRPDGLRDNCRQCERKPPRELVCDGCGTAFTFEGRGIAPHFCRECDERFGWCFRCKTAKPAEDFYLQQRSRTGRSYACRDCILEGARSDKGVRQRKAAAIRKNYGMSIEEYETHVLAADGVCPICKREGRKKMVMDHNHITGQVRGLICSACNSGIGLLGDSVAGLRAALAYLERFEND